MEIAYRIGMVLEGYVTGIQPYGAFVALDEETQIGRASCRERV